MADFNYDLLCYNKGCGQRYKEEDNTEDSCQYHPGVPVFHDALKGWSCCTKRSTDFTEFLNIPGCVKGPHSNEKPMERQKSVEAPLEKGDVIEVGVPSVPPQTQRMGERPPADNPMIKLKYSVSKSLRNQLKKLGPVKQQVKESDRQEEEEDGVIRIGTKCANNGCSATYDDSHSDLTDCVHHPGIPVFHEGCKFWSCCQKKTTDFNEFLRQEGCTTGSHEWKNIKVSDDEVYCRKDWHQTPRSTIVAIYAKNCVPEECTVEANETVLSYSLSFNNGQIFKEQYPLFGIIDPSKCSVQFLAPKVEITLSKLYAFNWTRLEQRPPQPPTEAKDEDDSEGSV